MALRNLYKNKIDDIIQKLLNLNIVNVYGGYTEQHLNTRKSQHIRNNENFKNMKIKKIFQTDKESQIDQIQLAEQYLINELDRNFGMNICLNDYNRNGQIAQRGGAGMQYNQGDVMKIYIMYK